MTYNHVPKVRRMIERAAKRRASMQALLDAGWTYKRIGKKYGISHQRAHQILNPDSKEN